MRLSVSPVALIIFMSHMYDSYCRKKKLAGQVFVRHLNATILSTWASTLFVFVKNGFGCCI